MTRQTGKRWLAAATYALPVLLILHAIGFWGRGIIDREAVYYVVNYQAGRPLLATIFDPFRNNGGDYQARELSYFFDFIDSTVFAALLKRHILLFVPFSGVIGLIAVAGIYLWGARRVLGLDHITAALLLSLFLSCIVTQASTSILYRSAKILLSVALLTFLLHLSLLVSRNQRASRRNLIGLFLLGLIMSVSDPQGFYYLVVATAIVTMLWLAAITRSAPGLDNHLRIIVTSLYAIAAAMFYNRIGGPMLIHWANGYWPNFSFQELPIGDLFAGKTFVSSAWGMFRAQTSGFFGNAPFVIVALTVTIACVGSAWRRRSTDVLIVWLATSVSLVMLLALMILRHPPVYLIPDHSFWYYTLTIHVVFLFCVTLLLSSLGGVRGVWEKVGLYLLLLLMIGNNVRHYPAERTAMINSARYFKGQYARSQRFVDDFEALERRNPPEGGRWPPSWMQVSEYP